MRLRWNRRFAFFLTATHAAWHEFQLSIDGEAQSLGSDLSENVDDLHARLVRAAQRYGG